MGRITLKDIRVFLFVGYVFFYLLAIAGPIFIDPLLASHVQYPSRVYPYRGFCWLALAALVVLQLLYLRKAETARGLSGSIGIFLICTLSTLPIFRPEFPHGNVVSVAVGATFFSALTIFVWWIGQQIVPQREEPTAGRETIEYYKASLSFIRQATFAGVALFGTFFIAAYSTGFSYVQTTVTPSETSAKELFLLKANISFQIAFYGIYALAGVIRYFSLMALDTLRQFHRTAAQADDQTARLATTGQRAVKPGKPSDAEEENEDGIVPDRAAT